MKPHPRILLVGAGQIGSRHLQGLSRIGHTVLIEVVDPLAAALRVAQERYQAVSGGSRHQVAFLREIPVGGSGWDLVIVATNADVRLNVLREVLNRGKIRALILEKLLFSEPTAYDEAWRLLSAHRDVCWVNCPMRGMELYRELGTFFGHSPVTMDVSGSGFGLVTNVIHYLDYLAFLSEGSDFRLDLSGLEFPAVQSKRAGFIDFHGTISASFPNGSMLKVTSFRSGTLPLVLHFTTATQRVIIREAACKASYSDEKGGWAWSEKDVRIPLQSEMSGDIARMILEEGKCPLPRLDESLAVHRNLLRPLGTHIKERGVEHPLAYPFT